MIKREETMAIIVDYQERLLPVIENHETLAKRSEILIKGLVAMDIPTIITQQYTKGLGMSAPFVFEAAGKEEYMEKAEFSSMKDAKIIKAVADLGKKNVVVCGIEAHICVLQTCLDLKEQGYQPILVLDCIGSRKRSDWEMTLIRAQQEGITVTTSESILFELLGEAGSDTFKTVSKLIK